MEPLDAIASLRSISSANWLVRTSRPPRAPMNETIAGFFGRVYSGLLISEAAGPPGPVVLDRLVMPAEPLSEVRPYLIDHGPGRQDRLVVRLFCLGVDFRNADRAHRDRVFGIEPIQGRKGRQECPHLFVGEHDDRLHPRGGG